MEALQNFFEWLGGYVWGLPLLILLGGTAIYLTLRLAFLQVTMLPMALKQAFSPPKAHHHDHEGDISSGGSSAGVVHSLSVTWVSIPGPPMRRTGPVGWTGNDPCRI